MNKYFFIFGLGLFLCFLSCQDPTDIGKSIIPNDDALQTDSITYLELKTNSFRDDSIINTNLNEVLVGNRNHPVFGESVASYFSELYYNGQFTVKPSAVFDSLVLYLNTPGFVGDESVSQVLEVYEMTDTITSLSAQSQSKIYIGETLPYTNKIGEVNATYSSDSTFIDGVKVSSHIAIRLDDLFGTRLFNKLNEEDITTNAQFQQYLNGLVVTPSNTTTGKGWFRIKVDSRRPDFTGLHLYYHDNDDTYKKEIPLGIVLDGLNPYSPGAQNFNRQYTDYTNGHPDIAQQLNSYSNSGNANGFIQSGNGIYTEIDFSGVIDQLQPASKVNYAELKVKPYLQSIADTISLPRTLLLVEKFSTSNGEKTGGVIGINGSNQIGTVTTGRVFDKFYDANLVKKRVGEYEYTFYLPNTLQDMHKGIIPSKLYVVTNSRTQSFYGLQLSNTYNANTSVSLKVFHTQTN